MKMSPAFSSVGALALLVSISIGFLGIAAAESSLVASWKAEASLYGEWSALKSDGTFQDLRLGQICDVYRSKVMCPRVLRHGMREEDRI
jgi:hypothetical protein